MNTIALSWHSSIAQNENSGLAINLAGRQRMLNQRLRKETLAKAAGVATGPDA